jgi:hypothetical protein
MDYLPLRNYSCFGTGRLRTAGFGTAFGCRAAIEPVRLRTSAATPQPVAADAPWIHIGGRDGWIFRSSIASLFPPVLVASQVGRWTRLSGLHSVRRRVRVRLGTHAPDRTHRNHGAHSPKSTPDSAIAHGTSPRHVSRATHSCPH